MSARLVQVAGRTLSIIEAGSGVPTVYLHGFADVHGVEGDLMPFHRALAERVRLIAPAHPGCNGSDDMKGRIRSKMWCFTISKSSMRSGLDRSSISSATASGAGSQRNSRCVIPRRSPSWR